MFFKLVIDKETKLSLGDKVAPHLGSNTIAVCRSKQWQVLHVCSEKETCKFSLERLCSHQTLMPSSLSDSSLPLPTYPPYRFTNPHLI